MASKGKKALQSPASDGASNVTITRHAAVSPNVHSEQYCSRLCASLRRREVFAHPILGKSVQVSHKVWGNSPSDSLQAKPISLVLLRQGIIRREKVDTVVTGIDRRVEYMRLWKEQCFNQGSKRHFHFLSRVKCLSTRIGT
jgi:hypothetical protein